MLLFVVGMRPRLMCGAVFMGDEMIEKSTLVCTLLVLKFVLAKFGVSVR